MADPYGNFRFKVEFDNILHGAFTQVSGLEATIQATEYREGGDTLASRKLPGRVSYSNVQLRNGITSDPNWLYDWHQRIASGTTERHTCTITLQDRAGKAVTIWDLRNAWPVRYAGPELNAEANDVAVEVLELAHDGLSRSTP